MLRDVIELQNAAVEKLLIQIDIKDEITFKAPTGSGKTYMMADFMNRVLTNDPNVVFLVSSLSKGDLAAQNNEKFKEYVSQGKFMNLNSCLISTENSENCEGEFYISPSHNVYVLPRDLYKKNGKLMRGAMITLLNTITSKHFTNGLNKKIYLIKDESHIATNNLDNLSDEYFTKVINFSATPKLPKGQLPEVEITENEAKAANLIKTIVWGDKDDKLANALYKFKELKEEYLSRVGISPCMIIQISNKAKADDELNNEVFPTLNSKDFNDLKWMLIVNEDKKCDTNDRLKTAKLPVSRWKDYAKSNHSSIDIIIFKVVITEGWDIPRACMLFQIRKTHSEQLDEQVIGRVRRNPCLLNFEKLDKGTQEFITKAYVWGNKPDSLSVSVPVRIKEGSEDTLKIMTTRLKSIEERKSFDIKKFVDEQSDSVAYGSIFDLYEKFSRLDPETKQTCFNNIDSYSEWYKYAYNSSKIQSNFKQYIRNYEETMELTTDEDGNIKTVTFPVISTYDDKQHQLKVKNWVWCRSDGSDKFSFDSKAEMDFAEELKEFVYEESETKDDFVWGKNFLPNSEIRYEYYSEGIHSSYPDFILKDKKGKIHIFEVKSINESSSINLDRGKYEEKIRALEECYKQAAVLTGYCFYLPIQVGDTWDITKIEKDGNKAKVTKNLSIDTVLNQLS